MSMFRRNCQCFRQQTKKNRLPMVASGVAVVAVHAVAVVGEDVVVDGVVMVIVVVVVVLSY